MPLIDRQLAHLMRTPCHSLARAGSTENARPAASPRRTPRWRRPGSRRRAVADRFQAITVAGSSIAAMRAPVDLEGGADEAGLAASAEAGVDAEHGSAALRAHRRRRCISAVERRSRRVGHRHGRKTIEEPVSATCHDGSRRQSAIDDRRLGARGRADLFGPAACRGQIADDLHLARTSAAMNGR